MSSHQTRVALVTTQDPLDFSSWSGTQYRVYQQLKKHFDVVEPIGPVRLNALESLVVKISNRLFPLLFRKYSRIHNLIHGFLRARHFTREISESGYSLVFASACCPVAAFLKAPVPIVYLSDATFRILEGYYEQFSGLSRFSRFEAEFAERRALANASLILFSSEWARQSAIRDYGIDPDRVKVCLFGANIDDTVPALEASPSRLPGVGKRCDLLFLARDWRRKGGPVALETFRRLRERGYEVSLTICGCEPEPHEEAPGLTVIPFLNKALAEDRERYNQLMLDSHFLILPTVADCTPMVLAEANAYSMPVLTSDTGGIPSLVSPGESGFLLPADADGEAYADLIVKEYFERPEAYAGLARSARLRYEQALNWDSWGTQVRQLIEYQLTDVDGTECYE